jgi:predicted RNase H-like HicB family nuclease
MTYRVFLQPTGGDSYRATPLLFPDCVAEGSTRDEALANLTEALNARLAEGEIVTIEVGAPEHSWLRGAGIFKNDPSFDDFLAEIDAYRRDIDEAERQRANLSP